MRISDWSSDVCSSDLAEDETDIQARVLGLNQLVLPTVVDVEDALRLDDYSILEDQVWRVGMGGRWLVVADLDLFVRSEEHTSELQSLMRISYAVFCLKKKKKNKNHYSKPITQKTYSSKL